MKLKYIGVMSMILGLCQAAPANANLLYDFYAGAAVGVGGQALLEDGDHEFHNAQSYAAALGINIPLLRIEAEYDYLHAKTSKMQLGMANAYVKFLPGVLQPYIGGGIGMVFDGTVADIDVKTTAAYQGMLGVTINPPVLPLALDLEGRVLYIPDILDIDDHKPDVLQYEGRIKLRYIF